jgi:hypothetical protein
MKKRTRKITFPDSGKEAHLPNVSLAALASKMKRKYTAPKPPMQGADGVYEYNYTHPDYKAAMIAYNEFVGEQGYEAAMRRIYTKLHLTTEMLQDVEGWKEENPHEWDENDTDQNIWLEEIALSSENDLVALIDFLGAGDSNQETVNAIQDGFRDKVS